MWQRAWAASSRVLEALQRFQDLDAVPLRFLALLAIGFHDLLGGARQEIGIGELGVDALDVGLDLQALLLEPRALSREIDDMAANSPAVRQRTRRSRL